MASRAIQYEYSIFYQYKQDIEGGTAVLFNQQITNWSQDSNTDNPIGYSNQIVCDETQGLFTIHTKYNGENKFYVAWGLCIKTGLSTNGPLFSIHVIDSQGQLIRNYQSCSSVKSTRLEGYFTMELPAPTDTSTFYSYQLSLVNESNQTFYYYTNIYSMAEIAIISIPGETVL